MTEYETLNLAALPDLAATATGGGHITARLAAFETLAARVSEIPGAWCGFDDSERAALRAAFALDADAMAAQGFTTAQAA